MNTAKYIKRLDDFTGEAKLFRLSKPIIEDGREYKYVVVSATVSMSGPETYIFPADKNGRIFNWGELIGSYKGGLDINRALMNAGYEVVY